MSNTDTDVPKGLTQLFVLAPGLEPDLRHSLGLAHPGLTAHFVGGLDDAALAADQGAEHGLVLVVRPDPFAALAALLADTGDQARAIAAWVQDTEALVQRSARLRRRLLLVDRAAFVAGDAVLHRALADRLGGSLLHPGWMAQAPALPVSAQMLVMAHALIQSDERLLSLCRQVEVLTQPASNAGTGLTEAVSAAMAEGEVQRALSAEVGQAREAASERDLLRAALVSLLAEVDSHLETIAAGQASQAQMRDALAGQDVLLADLASLQRRHGAAETDRLHREDRMGEAILDMGRQIDALTEAGYDHAATVTALQAELDRILRSKSWRVTAPLRATRRTIGRPD